MSVDFLFYVYFYFKIVLNWVIERDLEFLVMNFVMDYLFFVGVDEIKKELVIGIIGIYRYFMFMSILCFNKLNLW